jgi:hypothetical protein
MNPHLKALINSDTIRYNKLPPIHKTRVNYLLLKLLHQSGLDKQTPTIDNSCSSIYYPGNIHIAIDGPHKNAYALFVAWALSGQGLTQVPITSVQVNLYASGRTRTVAWDPLGLILHSLK